MVIVELTSHIYAPLSNTLCFSKAVCSRPSRSRQVTRIMSRKALFFNDFGKIHTSTITSTILCIRTTECMRTRQSLSLYDIVRDCSDEGGSSLCQGPRRRRKETVWKWRRIKTSLVVVMYLLCVMTCVVFYKLFWNWIDVVWFVSHKVWSDDEFVIWHFLYCCFWQIVSLWLLSIWIRKNSAPINR